MACSLRGAAPRGTAASNATMSSLRTAPAYHLPAPRWLRLVTSVMALSYRRESNPRFTPDFRYSMAEQSLRRRVSRVLVVEDNADNRLLMRELLESRGYDVTIAGDANEAEAAIAEHPPDLILLDVAMPARSGYGGCPALKTAIATPPIPPAITTPLTT